jgi:arylsulfatase A-like enzyme
MVVAALVAILTVAAAVEAPARSNPSSGPPAPTIVLILTDDQRADLLARMPWVQSDLVAHGTTFRNAFVVNPLCCPSRASILTGNYSHTTGVYANNGRYGGYRAFHNDGDEGSTIATWLDDAGWRTALIGKYLNGYGDRTTEVPPGWDRWVTFSVVNGHYYDYQLNIDGRLVDYGSDPQDYSTDVLAGYAVDEIAKTPRDEPLFLYVAPFSPHAPYVPAPRDADLSVEPTTLPPSFNEGAIEDKPPYVRERPHVDPADAQDRYANWVRMLASADEAVHSIVDALRESGRLADAMIVLTSDNGMLNGEHRLTGKLAPYEESIRVPLVIRDDGMAATAPAGSPALALNIDLAPTFASFAGVDPPATEGRSLLPVLDGSLGPWRDSFLVEHLYRGGIASDPPTYCAMRTRRWMFVHYADGFEELYDLRTDPYELRNVAGASSFGAVRDDARKATRRLCRPRPPGMPAF